MSCVLGASWRMRMSSSMRWRSGLTFDCEEVMIGLLPENEADCLIRQHTEPRCRPLRDHRRLTGAPTARAVSFFDHLRTLAHAFTQTFERQLSRSQRAFW